MAYDISTEIDTIENTLRGEDFRDAVVSAFRKIGNITGDCVMLTTAEWEALSNAEKTNGTLYFVSDMDIIDEGDTYGFMTGVTSDAKLLVSFDIGNSIVSKVKSILGISGNASLSNVPSFLDMIVNPKLDGFIEKEKRYQGMSYVSTTGVWTYQSATGTSYVIDVYKVEEDTPYVILLGPTVSNRFRVAFFSGDEDPTERTSSKSGTLVYEPYSSSVIKPWLGCGYTPSSDGYLLINVSSSGITTPTPYVLPESAFLEE